MAFDINNFVIDHVLRGFMVSAADGSYMWSVNQITEPSLSVTADNEESVDALGSPIATFFRNKRAEFSANNSLFDLSLFAAQNGVAKQVASAAATIPTPAFETITVAEKDTSKVLSHTPLMPISEIFQLKGDGALGTKYTVGTTASADKFVYDEASHTITFPTGLATGTQLIVLYEYAAENAVAVTGDAVNFPKAGKFYLEVLGTDTCDPNTLIHAYVVFPNAKLDANVDISFTTDGNHPFKIICQQNYCDSNKVLYQVIIPDEE